MERNRKMPRSPQRTTVKPAYELPPALVLEFELTASATCTESGLNFDFGRLQSM